MAESPGWKKVSLFIVNQRELDVFVKGYSNEETIKALWWFSKNLDSNDPCLPWYCIVPYPYSVADCRHVESGKNHLRRFLSAEKLLRSVLQFQQSLKKKINENERSA